jgi:hypothetical protein
MASADHNSPNGEGWANMPNDIHNTRMDTKETDDNEAFRDFVKYGEGSDSENRFDSDDTTAKQEKAQQGMSSTAETQQKMMQGSRTTERDKDQARSRTDKAASSTARQRTAMQQDRGQRPERQMDSRQRGAGKRHGG